MEKKNLKKITSINEIKLLYESNVFMISYALGSVKIWNILK